MPFGVDFSIDDKQRGLADSILLHPHQYKMYPCRQWPQMGTSTKPCPFLPLMCHAMNADYTGIKNLFELGLADALALLSRAPCNLRMDTIFEMTWNNFGHWRDYLLGTVRRRNNTQAIIWRKCWQKRLWLPWCQEVCGFLWRRQKGGNHWKIETVKDNRSSLSFSMIVYAMSENRIPSIPVHQHVDLLG